MATKKPSPFISHSPSAVRVYPGKHSRQRSNSFPDAPGGPALHVLQASTWQWRQRWSFSSGMLALRSVPVVGSPHCIFSTHLKWQNLPSISAAKGHCFGHRSFRAKMFCSQMDGSLDCAVSDGSEGSGMKPRKIREGRSPSLSASLSDSTFCIPAMACFWIRLRSLTTHVSPSAQLPQATCVRRVSTSDWIKAMRMRAYKASNGYRRVRCQ
mmetsp:Transcript_46910/g.87672  ORF Transcript_46910/g.87672 Transcript_46910/m.87672 type:complete len:211 (-) Transcript_46910:30-662(-)